MPPLDSEELFDLTRKEKRVYQFKEALQKRMLFFFGIAAGLSVIFDSAYNYYYLYSVRLSMPKYADTMHFDLEYDAIVSIFAGVVITLTPIFISHLLSERPAEDYATIRYEKYSIGTHLLGLISIHVALLILAFGAYIALVSYSFERDIFSTGMIFMATFGALFLAGPLMVEGFWTLYAVKNKIKKVYVLRRDVWRSW